MANPEHVKIAKLGGDAITKWHDANPKDKLDLSGASFTQADFRGANLRLTNLSKTDLSDAKMMRADLRSATLTEAKLIRTNLSSADLSGCDLTDADLSGAQLAQTILKNSTMTRTNFSRALSCFTDWVFLDLSQARGLETINHFAPSSIGVDTLMKSAGKIPEAFLRGCGLSDEFIAYIPSHFSRSAIEFYSCFISYSHEDKSFARRLHDALQGRGVRCWLDEHQILPGDNIYDRIDHGIRVWDKILLCASKNSLTSGWVDDELKHAFAKEKQLFKDRGSEVLCLIPLNLDGYLFSDWKHPKKNQVLERMAPDFTGWESDNAKFEQQFERVVKALQTNNTGREPEPKPKL